MDPCACGGTSVTYGGRAVELGQEKPTEEEEEGEGEGEGGGRRFVALKGTTTMAGSCVLQWDTFVSLRRLFRVSVARAVMMLSETPARIAGLCKEDEQEEGSGNVGVIQPGAWADFLCLQSNEGGGRGSDGDSSSIDKKEWSLA